VEAGNFLPIALNHRPVDPAVVPLEAADLLAEALVVAEPF